MASASLQVDSDEVNARRRILSGDLAAWKVFVDRYECRLRSFLRSRCYPLDAEDLAQETWVKIMSPLAQTSDKAGQLRIVEWDPQQGRFWSWLMTVAQNHMFDAFKRLKRRAANELLVENLADRGKETDRDFAARAERIAALRECLSKAAGELVKALQLRLKGCSYREISESLALPMGTVASKISRTKQQVASCLKRKLS